MVEVPTGDEHDTLAARVGALETRAAAAELLAGGLAARIAALEKTPQPDPEPEPGPAPTRVVRVNAGGPALTYLGVTWEADRDWAGGQTSAQGTGHYGGPSVYDTERWGSRFTYTLTGLPVGPATARLHFAENYEPTDRPGERVFAVKVGGPAGGQVGTEVDIVDRAGGQHTPVVVELPTVVPASGRLAAEFTGLVNAAALHGLEVFCYGTGVPAEPGPDPVPQPGEWPTVLTPTPGIPWPGSGGNPNNNKQETALAFGAWRGAPVTSALAFPVRDGGWDTLVSATDLPQGVWTDKSIRLFVQMSPFPKGNWAYAAAARGEYNGYYKRLGQNWRARGFKVTISFAWEANHNGPSMHFWGGPGGGAQRFRDYDEYIKTWRQFAKSVREGWPDAGEDDLRLAWIPNGHDSIGFPSNNPFDIYPGDDVVDVIGVDYYDQFPPSAGPKKKDFWAEADDVNGVRWYAKQALARGKLFAVPEWAVVGGDSNHGGDNPEFPFNMRRVFEEAHRAGVMFCEHYYEDWAQLMTMQGGQNPRAGVEYRRWWRQ